MALTPASPECLAEVFRRTTLTPVKERVAARVWHAVCDKLVHIAIPLLAVIGCLIFGSGGLCVERGLVSNATIQPS